MKIFYVLLLILLISVSYMFADAKLTVTVYDDNGPVNGMTVTVKAYVYDRDARQYYFKSLTGLTGNQDNEGAGESKYVFKGNIRFDNGEKSIIKSGSGIFSKRLTHEVRLYGERESVTIRR